MSRALPTWEEHQHCREDITEQAFRRGLADDELIRCIDVLAYFGGESSRDTADYQAELTRRETERQSKRLEWLTWALVALTIVITIATVALLVRGE